MGELARMPGAPKVAETPLELLTPRPDQSPSNFWRYVSSGVGAVAGVGSSIILNMTLHRPVWASLPRHIVLGGLGYYLTNELMLSLHKSKMEEDAVYKHYMSLHPEDFPPFERKRWGEIYEPFHPVR